MANITTNTLKIGDNNLVLRDADAQAKITTLKEDIDNLDDRVTVLEESGGGISMTAVNLLDTILNEAVYGTDQTANIALLKNELSKIPPVSISAVLDGTALEGQNYSELDFIVTATFDDESTVVVDDYTLVTTGTVVAGSNTVTIRYRGVTTTCTFTAEAVITYNITYNLSNVTSSNTTTVVVEDSYYSTVLSIPEEYGFDGCTVTMGGVDVTSSVYSNMEILITEVTGDVVISATATAYTYMDDLIRSNGSWSNLSGYSGEITQDTSDRIISINYSGTVFVSEYPALNQCSLHWVIENNTDSTIALTGVGFGAIPSNTTSYPNDSQWSYISIPYCIKCTNQSNSLEPGASIEGDYTLRAGHQLAFIAVDNSSSNLTVSVRGNYSPNNFSDCTAIPLTKESSNTNAYKSVTFYSDNGEAKICDTNGYHGILSTALEAGTYDVYYRHKAIDSTDKILNKIALGEVETQADTVSYYAAGCEYPIAKNLWIYLGRMTVSVDNKMIICSCQNNMSSIVSGVSYLDFRAKEVTA